MMTALRNNTKPIIWFTAVAFVVGFILILGTDFLFGTGAPPRSVAALVNGREIQADLWQTAVQNAYNNYRAQTGQNPDPATDLRLQAQAWEQLIQEALVAQEAERLGIEVTDKELAFAVLNQPLPEFVSNAAFQTDGQFDLRKYQAALSNPQFNTVPLENFYRRNLPIQKVQERVIASARVGEEELWDIFRKRNEKIRLEMANIPAGLVAVPDGEQDPGDAVLSSFLEEHSDLFAVPEQANLDYVRISKSYSLEDSLEAYETVKAAQEEIADGEDFNILVEAYSEAPPSRRGGDQGTLMRREQFASPALRDTSFALDVGEVSGVIHSRDGFHIVQLQERVEEGGVDKVKIAEIFVPLRPSYDTFATLRDSALAVADSAKAAGFFEAVTAFGMEADTTGYFSEETFPRGLGLVRAAIEFAFEAAPGDVSRPIETADSWVIVHLGDRTPPRDPELSEVRERVRLEWVRDRRRELAARHAEALLAEIASGNSLKETAEADSLARYQDVGPITRAGFIPGVGALPELVGAAFARDTTSAPQLFSSDRGAFVYKVLEKIPASRDGFSTQKEALRAQVLGQRQNEVFSAWISGLRENAEIEDFRTTRVSL